MEIGGGRLAYILVYSLRLFTITFPYAAKKANCLIVSVVCFLDAD